MNALDKLWLRKYALSQLSRFKARCYICHTPMSRPKRMTFHHLWYDDEDMVVKSFSDSDAYTKHILDQVEKHPEKFRLLCGGHHQAVSKLAQYGKVTLGRLLKVVRETRERKDWSTATD